MKKLIIYLIRKRLGVKLGERFQFTNQSERNKDEYYFFTDTGIMKAWTNQNSGREYISHSGVGLNWLLDDNCEIRKEVQ